jgi:hypothetical protein
MKAAAVFLTLALSLGVPTSQSNGQATLNEAIAGGYVQTNQPTSAPGGAAGPTVGQANAPVGQTTPPLDQAGPPGGQGEPQPGAPAGPVTVTRVKVSISAYREILEVIQPYLLNSLQEQGDIELAQDDAEWSIEVVTTPIVDDEKNVTALGLSIVIQQHWPHAQMMGALEQACRYFVQTGYLRGQPLQREMERLIHGTQIVPKPKGLAVVAKHRMAIVTPENLAQACQDIVKTFREERAKAQAQPSGSVAESSERITGPVAARNPGGPFGDAPQSPAGPRQRDTEGHALARAVLRPDLPASLGHDALNDAEP